MNYEDMSFDAETQALLRGLIGKTFNMYKYEPLEYSSSVYGIVGIFIDNESYKLTNFHETISRFGTKDDVGVLKFQQSTPQEIDRLVTDEPITNYPIENSISQIIIVSDRQKLKTPDNITYSFTEIRGIIFVMADGLEIAFTNLIWFSELIDIKRGYKLLGEFPKAEEFLEEWEDCEGYVAECERIITSV